MILDEPGQSLTIDDVIYDIGMMVEANDASEFCGLAGRIVEIRTDDDLETDNVGPDIYCDFEPPIDAVSLVRIEALLTEHHGTPVSIAELCAQPVIMAPHTIEPIDLV